MVAARSAAMGFNRLVDASLRRAEPAHRDARAAARRDDAHAKRRVFVVVSSVVFVFAAWQLGPLCFALSPVALAIVFWYSLAKRFTSYTQLFLGLAMAVAPVGGWLAAGGRGGVGAVAARPGDRHLGRRLRRALCLPGSRRSIARTACARSRCASASARSLRHLARACTSSPSLCLAALGPRRGPWLDLPRRRRRRRAAARLRAVAGQRARSVAGQARVRSERLRRHPLSRDDRGWRSMSADATRARSRSRSPAPAARCTRRGRWRRCSSAAATSS